MTNPYHVKDFGIHGEVLQQTRMNARRMNDKRLKYWLALTRVKGPGPFLKGLLDKFSEAEEIFALGGSRPESYPPAFSKALREFSGWDWVDNELRLISASGARILTYNDPGYPRLLKEIDDPPCVLYALGEMYDQDLTAVAVVGTRHPTHYGLRLSETISRDLAAMGVVVVSGMARGCDMAAHKGALSSGGTTVAVMGTGVDVVYPRENKPLYDEIAKKGLVISEFPMSTPPAAYTFPQRNRIIAGMTRATLVIEAPLKSGSLMTAQFALDYNRDVLACPGQASSLKSSGANKLIKDGAVLIESAEDVLGALSLKCSPREARSTPELGEDESLVWQALEDEPIHIDRLIEKTGLSAGRASAALLEMELKGFIWQHPGKMFLRRF